jgi:hypothetical protein
MHLLLKKNDSKPLIYFWPINKASKKIIYLLEGLNGAFSETLFP